MLFNTINIVLYTKASITLNTSITFNKSLLYVIVSMEECIEDYIIDTYNLASACSLFYVMFAYLTYARLRYLRYLSYVRNRRYLSSLTYARNRCFSC